MRLTRLGRVAKPVVQAAVFAGLFALFFLEALDGFPRTKGVWQWIDTLFSGQNAPSWVQAIGSVAAILAAIEIANAQDRRKRTDERARAVVVAAGVHLHLSDPLEKMDVVIRNLVKLRDGHGTGYLLDDTTAKLRGIVLPQESAILMLVPLEGNAAESLALAVAHVALASNLLTDIQAGDLGGSSYADAFQKAIDTCGMAKDYLRSARHVLSKVVLPGLFPKRPLLPLVDL